MEEHYPPQKYSVELCWRCKLRYPLLGENVCLSCHGLGIHEIYFGCSDVIKMFRDAAKGG